jgi:hypothetical protein
MDHEQFEILIAAILTAGQLGSPKSEPADVTALLAKTLAEMQRAQIIVKKNANFIPKGR